MGYWLWKNGEQLLAFSPPQNYEDICKEYPDAVPVKPRFVRRGERVSLPKDFIDDFNLVMKHYGEGNEQIETQWKPYVREYPEHAVPCIRAAARNIRRSVEYQMTERIRHNSEKRSS